MACASPLELANALRALSMDAVEKAQSGHPGMPMGMADIATVLWRQFLNHCPDDPHWLNRDRFILSNGHGAMLHYALLHLSGYKVSIEDIKQFRQLHSLTAGHPEIETPGVETTTGPLGQGLANAVGMALAEQQLGLTFNRPNYPIIDHWTYVFLGDGCLMEGLSHEVCSLAGTLKLGKLIAFWDDNQISIDGTVDKWFTDDTPARFKAYGWLVIENVDGHDPASIEAAIKQAKAQNEKPTLICCRTTIGFGAPNKAGTAGSHGAPLGQSEIEATRKQLNWTYGPFEIPDTIYHDWDATQRGNQLKDEWLALFKAYQNDYSELADELKRRTQKILPAHFNKIYESALDAFIKDTKSVATRKSSYQVIEHFAKHCPELLGGSADLTGSNLTQTPEMKTLSSKQIGQYLHYGVREFGMAAIMNGISLYGGFKPYGGTFLTFSDYMRSAIRMSALMELPVIYILTHDSIGLGEDGPTHQPIEHLAMLRATPQLLVWRPADGLETLVAWKVAMTEKKRPTCMALSRQSVPVLERQNSELNHIERGGYALITVENPDLILIGTGSEVSLCVEAAKKLKSQSIKVQVVSLPCWELFDEQSHAYREQVIPPGVPCLAVEAASCFGWERYVGSKGKILGINSFGLSAPYEEIFNHFGLTVENIINEASALLS